MSLFESFNENEKNEIDIINRISSALEFVNNDQVFLYQESIEETIQLLIESDFVDEGLILADALLEIAPYNSEYWYYKGSLLNNAFSFEEAYLCLDKAQSLNPSDADTLINKSIAADNLGLKEEAAECLIKAIELEPKNDEALFNLGVLCERNDDFASAATYFEAALDVDQEYTEAWFELAYCYEIIDRLEDSLKAYDLYMEAEPYSPTGWYNRGIVLIKMSRYKEAIESFELAASLKDDFSSAWFNTGVAYTAIAKFENAVSAFERALEIDQDDESILYNLGVSFEALNNTEKAIEYYSKAIEVDSSYFEAYLARGFCYFTNNLQKLAEDDLREAFILYSLDEINIDRTKTEDSLQDTLSVYEEMSREEPENVELKQLLVQNYADTQNWEDAFNVVDELIGLDNENITSYFLKAMVYFKSGQVEEAVEFLKITFNQKPEIKDKFAKTFPEINSSKLFNNLIDKK